MTTFNTLLTSKKRKQIKDLVLKEFQNCNITNLPINLLTIVKYHSWYLITYSDAINLGYINKIEKFNAIHICYISTIIIIYNENHCKQRIRWSIAHEIGHILLNHKVQSNINEAEANYFTKQLLEPLAVIAEMDVVLTSDISKLCNISIEAAEIRYNDLQRHYNYKSKYGLTKHDISFLRQFGRTEFASEFSIA